MVRVIAKLGHQVIETSDAEDALDKFKNAQIHLMVTDYKMLGMNGIELLAEVNKLSPETEVMMVTAFGSIELAVQAMQRGATDFITKPFSPDELSVKVQRLAEHIHAKQELRRVSDENRYLREQVEGQFNFGEIIGESEAMRAIFRTVEKVARGDSSVIVYGESGTGKELVARAIHKASPRRQNAFVRVNCGALAEGVLESELFGHERGAFTGAVKRRKGRFELAQNGSIFLDEIGDIPLGTQVKLLRVLQEREFERVGGEETLNVDVRIIAATNKDLLSEIKKGQFREDLYYRLHIIPIHLPPLRERKDDIPFLADHFIKKLGSDLSMPHLSITQEARQRLLEYDWPGNIREFENVLERAAVLSDNQEIHPSDLPLVGISAADSPPAGSNELDLTQSLETLEKSLLQKALAQSRGVKSEAARLLGIKTSAFYYKLEKYGLKD